MLNRKTHMRRTPFKAKARKKRAWHDKAATEACRDQECYLRVPSVCCGDSATVVPCHANWSAYGKGAGRKADDKYTVPGCWTCHQWLDQGRAPDEEKRATWESAYERWSAYRDSACNYART